MTHNQTLAALDKIHTKVEQLSREFTEDRDFWPAYAEQANDLEAGSTLDFRDYVRDSILRTMHTISRTRT